jgi:hypothetical protein
VGIVFVAFLWIMLIGAFAAFVGVLLALIAKAVRRYRNPALLNFPGRAFRASFWIVPIFIAWAISYAEFVERFGGQGYHIGDSWSVSLGEKYCMYAVDDPSSRSEIYPCTTGNTLDVKNRVIGEVKQLVVTPEGVFGVDATGPFRFDANSGRRESIESVAALTRLLPPGYELKAPEAAYYRPYGWQDAIGRWSFVVAIVFLLSFIARRYVWVREPRV